MAKGKKTGGNDFKPGASGNPNGRPKLPDDIVIARRLNQLELERVLNRYLDANEDMLVGTIKDRNAPTIDRTVASILYQALTKGDHQRFEWILQRLVGKVPEPQKARQDQELTIIELSNGKELVMGTKTRDVDEA